jgi:hypothetical protein
MSLISDGNPLRRDGLAQGPTAPVKGRFTRPAGKAANAVRASQARAALRRDARRDELAVAHWLRELSGRPR